MLAWEGPRLEGPASRCHSSSPFVFTTGSPCEGLVLAQEGLELEGLRVGIIQNSRDHVRCCPRGSLEPPSVPSEMKTNPPGEKIVCI